jgi:hypothetical protein
VPFRQDLMESGLRPKLGRSPEMIRTRPVGRSHHRTSGGKAASRASHNLYREVALNLITRQCAVFYTAISADSILPQPSATNSNVACP